MTIPTRPPLRNFEDLERLLHYVNPESELLVVQAGEVYRVPINRAGLPASLTVQKDGEHIARAVHTINVTGPGATVTVVNGVATINVQGP